MANKKTSSALAKNQSAWNYHHQTKKKPLGKKK